MKKRARLSNALYSLIRLTTARRRSWTGCLVNPVKALQPREPTPRQRFMAGWPQITSPSLLCEIRYVFPDQTRRNRGRKRGTRSLRRLYNLRGAHDISLVAGFAFQAYKHLRHTSPDIIPSRYPAYRTAPICSGSYYLPVAYGSQHSWSTRHNQRARLCRHRSSIYRLSQRARHTPIPVQLVAGKLVDRFSAVMP